MGTYFKRAKSHGTSWYNFHCVLGWIYRLIPTERGCAKSFKFHWVKWMDLAFVS